MTPLGLRGALRRIHGDAEQQPTAPTVDDDIVVRDRARLGAGVGEHDDGELKTLGLVDRHETHELPGLAHRRLTLLGTRLKLPELAHVGVEGGVLFRAEGIRQLDELVEVAAGLRPATVGRQQLAQAGTPDEPVDDV